MKLLLFIVGLTLVASGPSFRTLANTGTYTALTQAQIKSSAEVQGALKYGANKIIQDGYTKGKIPQSTYSITKVVSVGKQVVNSGKNAYQCQIELQGTNKVTVNAQFVVSVTVATQAYSLGAYSYSVGNLGGNTNPTQPSNTTNTTGNYTALNQTQINNSTEVQGALKYGANRTLQDGYSKGKIPVSNYSISQVVSVGKQTLSGKNAYQCQIELQGANNVVVDAQFVVYYNVSAKTYSLGTYSYNVSNLANTNTTNTTQPTNTTNTTSNYTALTQAEINSSAEVQSVLNYGVNQTLQDGYNKGKIPVSTYSISQVVGVGKQALSNGRNAYQCQIQLQGVNGAVVDSQFVVYVTVSTGALLLNSFSYQISNLGNTGTL